MKISFRKNFIAAAFAVFMLASSGALAASAKVLNLPNRLQKIEAYAFYGDMSLEKVVIPDKVTAIGEKAFAKSSVTKINLPASLTYIAPDAFDIDRDIQFTVSGAYAAEWLEGYMARKYPPLKIGSNTVSIPEGGFAGGSFTAETAGDYAFRMKGSSAVRCIAYDSGFNELMPFADKSEGSEIYAIYNLAAGEMMYLQMQYTDSETEGGTETLVIREPMQILQNGSNTVTVPTGEEVLVCYTAGFDGAYTFSADDNVTVTLYDSDMNPLEAENSAYTLSASQTVYAGLRFTDASAETNDETITVTEPEIPVTDTVYRALLIGQVNFDPPLNSTWTDVLWMEEMLQAVNNGQYKIAKKKDLTWDGVKNAISSAFAGADDDDVSLIFYSSHGVTDSGYFYGALWTYDDDVIRTEEFAEWLSEVPGKVIVLVNTCGSGALIGRGDGATKDAFDPEAFDESLIRAFGEADSRLAARSGELAAGKFYVMTSSMGGEYSWGEAGTDADDNYGYFTHWLYEGAGGTETVMPADTDNNRRLTLNEWYTYVKNRAALETFTEDDVNYYQQHPQVYPTNSDYVIFTK